MNFHRKCSLGVEFIACQGELTQERAMTFLFYSYGSFAAHTQ